MGRINVTLDTNALRDLVWVMGDSPENRYYGDTEKQQEVQRAFSKIIEARGRGKVHLATTKQLLSDFSETKGKLPVYLDGVIGPDVEFTSPNFFSFPLSFPVSFPDRDKYERLFAAVFPYSELGHQQYKNNRIDAWHLYAHELAGRSVFLTGDKKILDKAELLSSRWGIKVQSPHDFADNLEQSF